MNIAIVGAGIAGTATAFELAADGHQVTVFDRRSAAAEEASFATGGSLLRGSLAPWAAPGLPSLQAAQRIGRNAGFQAGWNPLGAANTWRRAWRKASRPARSAQRLATFAQLADYAIAQLRQRTDELQLEFEGSAGHLLLLRTDKEVQRITPALQELREAGVAARLIDAAETRAQEPALNPDTPLAGAVHFADEAYANCRQFALLLRGEAQRLGVRMRFGTAVSRIDPGGMLQLEGEPTPLRFDAVILCSGAGAPALLRPLNLRLPLAAVQGYTVSAPIREPLNAPRSAVIDSARQTLVGRLGLRVRVSGGATLGPATPQQRQAGLQQLYRSLQDWFPAAAQLSAGVQEWSGTRMYVPDGMPVLGPSGVPGLWLNLAHGNSGWLLASGCARLLADRLGGGPGAVATDGLGVERLLR